MKKKLLSLILVIVLVLPVNLTVLADTISNGSVKVSYIKNINNDGSNIGNDRSNSMAILSDEEYNIEFLLTNAKLELSGGIGNIPFSVEGAVTTTNENRNVLLYETNNLSGDYKSIFMSVERELDETALFFRNYQESNPLYTNVIKLYLQPNGTNDIIYIEVFISTDFVAEYLQNHNVLYDANLANAMQGWFVSIYDPIEDNNDVAPASAYATNTINLSLIHCL